MYIGLLSSPKVTATFQRGKRGRGESKSRPIKTRRSGTFNLHARNLLQALASLFISNLSFSSNSKMCSNKRLSCFFFFGSLGRKHTWFFFIVTYRNGNRLAALCLSLVSNTRQRCVCVVAYVFQLFYLPVNLILNQ